LMGRNSTKAPSLSVHITKGIEQSFNAFSI
jgi:hypothetical protein